MNRTKLVIAGCLLGLSLASSVVKQVQAAEWGNLTGQFKFTGERQTPAKLDINRDQEICGKFDELIVDQSGHRERRRAGECIYLPAGIPYAGSTDPFILRQAACVGHH